MDTAGIINALEAQKDRLDTAIAALRGNGKTRGRKPGSRKGSKLSAAARKRISDAMKKRWAARKKQA